MTRARSIRRTLIIAAVTAAVAASAAIGIHTASAGTQPSRQPRTDTSPPSQTSVVTSAVASASTVAPASADAATLGVTDPAAILAAGGHTVTFVNRSSETVWIGSAVNADGSKNFTSLPTLTPGQSATITIPETTAPNYWRGKFFARQGCAGTSGSTFHCLVGDCGVYADHCTTGEQPASLAEFNFDANDGLAPWYNVSYVNAFSLPITIAPNNAPAPPAGGGSCETMGCSEDLLQYCPSANASINPATGQRVLCTNPNRDAQTPYSNAITAHCPKAYSWSKQDTIPGNQTMRQCGACTGFTVTFNGGTPGGGGTAEKTGAITGFASKCVDVAKSDTANGTGIQLYHCNGTNAQQWTVGADGTLRAFGKCMDATGGGTSNGVKVQLYDCNGTGAQQWRFTEGNDLVNPQANKCLDVAGVNSADGTPLQIWDCVGSANQKWTLSA